jgi:hypothetical protein
MQLAQKKEHESELQLAYAASAEQDIAMAAQFDSTLADGLLAMPRTSESSMKSALPGDRLGIESPFRLV